MTAPHILLSFGTTLGRNRLVRVNNPDADVEDSVVRTAMNGLISSQAISGPSGRINTIRRASYIETHVQQIDIA